MPRTVHLGDPPTIPPIQALGGSNLPLGSERGINSDGAVDLIVGEYSELIARLSSLTEDLPKRLHCGVPTTPRSRAAKKNQIDSQSALAWEHPPPAQEHPPKDDVRLPMSGSDLRLELPMSEFKGHMKDSPAELKGSPSKDSQTATELLVNSIVDSQDSSRQLNTPTGKPTRAKSNNRRMSLTVSEVISRIPTLAHNTPDPEMLQVLHSFLPCIFRGRQAPEENKPVDNDTEDRTAQTLQEKLFAGVDATSFDVVVGFVIMANSVVMMVQLEYRGYLASLDLGTVSDRYDPNAWQNAQTWFVVLEHVFNALFLFEMVLRFTAYGRKLFADKVLIFDLGLVVASSAQLYILDPIAADTSFSSLSVFRMLRFVRLVRVLRIVRALRMFSALRVLVKTVISSFGALLHSMIFLFALMVLGGLFLCEVLLDFVQDDTNNFTTRQWVYKYYGTSSRAIYTLFEVTLAGCWPNYFRPLIHDVNGWFVAFSVVYISFVVFAVIRIITAIFLKHTMTIATNDADMMVQERFQATQTYIRKLKTLFEAVDVSGDGRLNFKEFETIVQNPRVKSWMQVLELEIHDARALFQLLDDGDGEVTFDEFLKGLMRLKGQARTMDVVSILQKTDKTYEEMKVMRSKIDMLTERHQHI